MRESIKASLIPAALHVAHQRQARPGVRDTFSVGLPLEVELAEAIAHRDTRAGDGLAAVERSHPDDRALAPVLQVHGKVGDQHAGRYVVGLLNAMQRDP